MSLARLGAWTTRFPGPNGGSTGRFPLAWFKHATDSSRSAQAADSQSESPGDEDSASGVLGGAAALGYGYRDFAECAALQVGEQMYP